MTFAQPSTSFYNRGIPYPTLPNNLIAVFWDDLAVGGDYNSGKVYSRRGGSAPNRYLVIEWWRVTRLGASDLLTFEAVLYENGDIVLQYQSLAGYLESCTVGIEDDWGSTGLLYIYNAPGLRSGKAIRLRRPAASARVKVFPASLGRFAAPGAPADYQVPIRNAGDAGADTFDLSVTSGWPVSLWTGDGSRLLNDTDGDGLIDTGSIGQAGTFVVLARVQTPAGAMPSASSDTTLTIRSSRNTSKTKTVSLRTAFPPPFAQVYWDNADGAMRLYLAQPDSQAVHKVSDDGYFGAGMSVAGLPKGFGYFWTRWRHTGSTEVREIEYALLDRRGSTVRAASRLVDHSSATTYTYDYVPVAAAAPGGRVGVLWYRHVWDSSNQVNCNLYFAILDAAGNLTYGPANITNNNGWGSWDALDVPHFYTPRIAATGDGRFVLAWLREHQGSGGWVDDIYYSVRDATGGVVRSPTRFTADTAGDGEGYTWPSLASLSGNRALLLWRRWSDGYVYYAVLGSSGQVVNPAAPLYPGYGAIDAVQLANGNTVVAWNGDPRSGSGNWAAIHYAVLNSSYNPIFGPKVLDNPATLSGDAYVSVTADQDNHAILTWADIDWDYHPNLYYALLDGYGGLVTPPQIFVSSTATWPYIETGYEGYSSAPYPAAQPLMGLSLPLALKNPIPPPPPPSCLEPANNYAAGACGPLTLGAVLRDHIDSEQDTGDWFYFDLGVPGTVEVRLRELCGQCDFDLYLYSGTPSALLQIGYSGEVGRGTEEHITPRVVSAGRYYVWVRRAEGWSATQPYALQVSFGS